MVKENDKHGFQNASFATAVCFCCIFVTRKNTLFRQIVIRAKMLINYHQKLILSQQ
jgi:hypothetical protein